MLENRPASSIQISKYILNCNQRIGRGSYGNVYKGFNVQNKQPVAIKVIKMSDINNQVLEYLHHGEIKAHQSIKNQFIITTHEVIQLKDYCYIVMELCTGGNLKEYIIKKGGHLTCQQAIQLFRKILLGYLAIINAQFLHRDIKSQNILLRSNGDPVIIDFGFCESMTFAKKAQRNYNVGTPEYMAPEFLLGNTYSEKSDVWGLGVILYEMISGKTFQTNVDMVEVFKVMLKEGIIRMDLSNANQLCRELINLCIHLIPEKRATAAQLLKKIDSSIYLKNRSNAVSHLVIGNMNQFMRLQNSITGPFNGEFMNNQIQGKYMRSKSSGDLQTTTIDTQGSRLPPSLRSINSYAQKIPISPLQPISPLLGMTSFTNPLNRAPFPRKVQQKPQSAYIKQPTIPPRNMFNSQLNQPRMMNQIQMQRSPGKHLIPQIPYPQMGHSFASQPMPPHPLTHTHSLPINYPHTHSVQPQAQLRSRPSLTVHGPGRIDPRMRIRPF